MKRDENKERSTFLKNTHVLRAFTTSFIIPHYSIASRRGGTHSDPQQIESENTRNYICSKLFQIESVLDEVAAIQCLTKHSSLLTSGYLITYAPVTVRVRLMLVQQRLQCLYILRFI